MYNNNKPYKDIEEFVKKDLYNYHQGNPAPISLTVISGNTFRHYELGNIIGYVLFGNLEDNNVHPFISEIHEDDENWFAPSSPMYMCASWMNSSFKTLQRMYAWYHNHIDEGYDDNMNWYSKIIKPIKSEEVYLESGQSSCSLFSKY